MSEYIAPLKDMDFVLQSIAGIERVSACDLYQEATSDLVAAVLEEGGKFAAEVMSPTNSIGDQKGCTLENGVVRIPEEFVEVYKRFSEAGWNSVPFDPEYGGQGLPQVVNAPLQEMWYSANMALTLGPLLTQGAIEAMHAHGSEEQRNTYLAKLISGKWSGTMNLTEPHAGTDVGALKSKAEPQADGTYRIKGQKIFITWGEHEASENIIHLVLARTPGSPDGTKGISLFIVPKYLVNPDGSLGERNDLRCAGLEEKIGIHASPTCVMAYGDNDGAIGYLIGEENKGMTCMFTMMNGARLSVGMQGLAIAERAYQHALAYAKDRVQGGSIDRTQKSVTIIKHPDVRRNLMLMKSQIEAMRGLAYMTMAHVDLANAHSDPEARKQHDRMADLLTPMVKGWCTDLGVELASLGVQIHGGMGFVEETGAGQYYRDARILPIYEGTNGIQALDLFGRKLGRDKGETAGAFIKEMHLILKPLSESNDVNGARIATALKTSLDELATSTKWILTTAGEDINAAASGATPYLDLFSITVGGWVMAQRFLAAKEKLAAGDSDTAFFEGQCITARFYADNILSKTNSLMATVMHSGDTTMLLSEDQF
jgi:alkylation response protein AidB-like acyl-CoA dehydrogenase